jgi:hypothetical protein
MFAELEDQMTSWVPGDPSPDRMDALVWAFTDLMLNPQAGQLQSVAGGKSKWTGLSDMGPGRWSKD